MTTNKQNYFTYIDNTSDDNYRTMKNLYKQIIVDNVDVSGCEYYFDEKCRCMDFCLNQDFYKCPQCKDNPNCHYKNWQHKEQSEEKLVKQIQTICDFINNRPETFKGINGSVDKIITDYAERKEQECEEWKHQAELGSDTTNRLAKQLEEKEQELDECREKLHKQLDQIKADNDSLKSELMQTNCYLEADKETIDQLKAENEDLENQLEREKERFEKNDKLASMLIQDLKNEKSSLVNEYLKKIGQLQSENEDLKKCYKNNSTLLDFEETNTTKLVNKVINLEKTLTEIKKVLQFYSNSTMGVDKGNGIFEFEVCNDNVLGGKLVCSYNTNPARQALQKIREVMPDEN